MGIVKNMELPFHLLRHSVYHYFGIGKKMPFSISIAVTSKCNSSCRTCRIWKNREKNELKTKEWEKIIRNLGNSPFWVTIGGGEPFLRKDLWKIIGFIGKYNHPSIISIATNGLDKNAFNRSIKKILANRDLRKISIIINVSIDAVGKDYNLIRGINGFKNVIGTCRLIKNLKNKHNNIYLGINSVISRFNIDKIKGLCDFVEEGIRPDMHTFEIAQNRKDLFNTSLKIQPEKKDCIKIIEFLIQKTKAHKSKGITLIKKIFRIKYYSNVIKEFKGSRNHNPCYSGIASVHISSAGAVYPCCLREDKMGDLRDSNYDLKRIILGKKAREITKLIEKRKCHCISVNSNYVNQMFNMHSILRIK